MMMEVVGPETVQLVPVGQAFEVGEHGLIQNSRAPSFEECGLALDVLKRVKRSLAWWWGDLLTLTETLFHEEASQLIDQELLTEKEINELRFVAQRVGVENRHYAPTWEHAKAVARMAPEDQKQWLIRATDEDWSVSKLKAEIAASRDEAEKVPTFVLVVECGTEKRQKDLGTELTRRGFTFTQRSGLKRAPKLAKAEVAAEEEPQKPKRTKKGPVTARPRRGARKMYTRRRK